jgi:hypothetical protein
MKGSNMRAVARFVFGFFAIAALVLLGASLFGAPGGTQTVAASTLQRVSTALPVQLDSFSNSAGAFFRRNATTAELQLESMTNSIPRNVASGDWFPRNSSNWIQGGAQAAAQAVGNRPGTLARKVPVVNRALNSADQHFEALQQTLSGAGSSF